MSHPQFTSEHLAKMKEGIELFNEQKYWECHESLEDVWIEDKNDPVRNVYWAVIQVAACLIHYRDDNPVGAHGLLKKSKEKFKRCEDMFIENDLLFNSLKWKELKKLVFNLNPEDKLSRFQELFEFRF